MYDLDVVFLLLSSPPSARFDDVLQLHDVAANAGFHTVVATSPAELAATGRRLRVVVVDGDKESDFDAYAVTAAMCALNNIAIVFLADTAPMASELGLQAGADICLPASVGADEFCRALIGLANHQPYTAPVDARRLVVTDTRIKSSASISNTTLNPPCWKLTNNGWMLCTPQGVSLRLTATERDLLTCLFTADDKTVYHAQWDRRYGRIDSVRNNKVSALSVLVGRLRRKCATLNIKLPLYVKRGSGYWFVDECRIISMPENRVLLQNLSSPGAPHEEASYECV